VCKSDRTLAHCRHRRRRKAAGPSGCQAGRRAPRKPDGASRTRTGDLLGAIGHGSLWPRPPRFAQLRRFGQVRSDSLSSVSRVVARRSPVGQQNLTRRHSRPVLLPTPWTSRCVLEATDRPLRACEFHAAASALYAAYRYGTPSRRLSLPTPSAAIGGFAESATGSTNMPPASAARLARPHSSGSSKAWAGGLFAPQKVVGSRVPTCLSTCQPIGVSQARRPGLVRSPWTVPPWPTVAAPGLSSAWTAANGESGER
jgi:hypothetical protein